MRMTLPVCCTGGFASSRFTCSSGLNPLRPQPQPEPQLPALISCFDLDLAVPALLDFDAPGAGHDLDVSLAVYRERPLERPAGGLRGGRGRDERECNHKHLGNHGFLFPPWTQSGPAAFVPISFGSFLPRRF